MSSPQTELFTRRLRDATKSIHDMSDHMVNLKLGVSMSDDNVWAEGLLVFYEVFRFLEGAVQRTKDSLLGEYNLIAGLWRTEALERDLVHFLGNDWNGASYEIRPEVGKYLARLKVVEAENPYLLVAYIYHMYMGLLSGGQILQAKRKLGVTSSGSKGDSAALGEAITHFEPPSRTIAVLKKEIREATNRIGEELDEGTREAVIAEGVKVFELNNLVIRSVKGVDDIFYRKLMWLVVILTVLALVFKFVLF